MVSGIAQSLHGSFNIGSNQVRTLLDIIFFDDQAGAVDIEPRVFHPGVKKVIKVKETAVAVVADTWWHAKTALDALPITWDEGDNAKVSSATIAEHLKTGLAATENNGERKSGDALAAIAGAAKKVEATYSTPFLSHACMEMMNATVKLSADKAEAWAPTQNLEIGRASCRERVL